MPQRPMRACTEGRRGKGRAPRRKEAWPDLIARRHDRMEAARMRLVDPRGLQRRFRDEATEGAGTCRKHRPRPRGPRLGDHRVCGLLFATSSTTFSAQGSPSEPSGRSLAYWASVAFCGRRQGVKQQAPGKRMYQHTVDFIVVGAGSAGAAAGQSAERNRTLSSPAARSRRRDPSPCRACP